MGLFLLFGFIFKHLLLKKKIFLATYVFAPTVPQLVYSEPVTPLHTSPSPQGWRAADFLTWSSRDDDSQIKRGWGGVREENPEPQG